jgi:hypothetical protein
LREFVEFLAPLEKALAGMQANDSLGKAYQVVTCCLVIYLLDMVELRGFLSKCSPR